MRQGLLSEPEASSGPAAMLLAVSRSPSSIPRRSPCPVRCHLPLASLDHIHLSKPQKTSPTASTPGPMPPSSGVSQPHPPLKTSNKSTTASTPRAMPPSSGVPQPHPPLKTSKNIPDCIHSRSDASFLGRPSTTSTHKTSKTSPTASTPGPMSPSSGVPQPHPPNETSNVSPPASNAKSRRQKNLSHRHETPAFSFPGLP